MSFSTATPDMAMNPTPAEIENGISRSHRAKTPPTQANGTPVKTRRASTRLSIGEIQQHENQHAEPPARQSSAAFVPAADSRTARPIRSGSGPPAAQLARRFAAVLPRRSCPGRGRGHWQVTVIRRWPHSRVIVEGPSTILDARQPRQAECARPTAVATSIDADGLADWPRHVSGRRTTSGNAIALRRRRPTACCRSIRPDPAPPGPDRPYRANCSWIDLICSIGWPVICSVLTSALPSIDRRMPRSRAPFSPARRNRRRTVSRATSARTPETISLIRISIGCE